MSNILSSWLKRNEHEVILCSLCFMALSFSFLNPLWFGQAPGFDGSLFAVIGKMFAEGEVLYRDVIDIKGPGIFFMDLIGYRIGGFRGIAFIETILLVFGVISLDLAMRVFRLSPLARFCSIVMVLTLHGFRYYYGNMTEDYALYFSMIASYPFALMLGLRRFSWRMGLFVSVLFGLTVSMRINNGAYFGAWYAMLFLFLLCNKKYLGALGLFVSSLIGLALVFGGFGLYFYHQGGMPLVNEAVFYSISIFFKDGAYGTPGFSILAGLTGLFRTGLLPLFLGMTLVLFRKDNYLIMNSQYNDRNWFMLYLTLGIIFAVIANSVSGHIFDHYDELFLPFMFLPLGFLVHRYLHVIQDINISFLTIFFLIIYLLSEHILWNWDHHEWSLYTVWTHVGIDTLIAGGLAAGLFFLRKLAGRYWHSHTMFLCLSIIAAFILGVYAIVLGSSRGRPWDENTQKIVDVIKARTQDQDRIWVEGDAPQYYLWTDRNPAAPHLFFGNVNPGYDVRMKVLSSITFFKPRFIVITGKKLNAYRDAEARNMVETAFSYSEQMFYRYIFSNYEEVTPRLFCLKSGDGVSSVAVSQSDMNAASDNDDSETGDAADGNSGAAADSKAADEAASGELLLIDGGVSENAPAAPAPSEKAPETGSGKGEPVELPLNGG